MRYGRRKISTTVYLTIEEDMMLETLGQVTGITKAAFIRRAIDRLLDEEIGKGTIQRVTVEATEDTKFRRAVNAEVERILALQAQPGAIIEALPPKKDEP